MGRRSAASTVRFLPRAGVCSTSRPVSASKKRQTSTRLLLPATWKGLSLPCEYFIVLSFSSELASFKMFDSRRNVTQKGCTKHFSSILEVHWEQFCDPPSHCFLFPRANSKKHWRPTYKLTSLISRQMWQNYQNMYAYFLKDRNETVINKVKKFFNDQDSWTRRMVKLRAQSDPYWKHMSYVLAQFDGLYAGYLSVAKSDWVSFWPFEKCFVCVAEQARSLVDQSFFSVL